MSRIPTRDETQEISRSEKPSPTRRTRHHLPRARCVGARRCRLFVRPVPTLPPIRLTPPCSLSGSVAKTFRTSGRRGVPGRVCLGCSGAKACPKRSLWLRRGCGGGLWLRGKITSLILWTLSLTDSGKSTFWAASSSGPRQVIFLFIGGVTIPNRHYPTPNHPQHEAWEGGP